MESPLSHNTDLSPSLPPPETQEEQLERYAGLTLPPSTFYRSVTEKDILDLFSPEEQVLLLEKKRLLSVLAYYIGKDFQIPVELNRPNQGWHWDFAANKIRIDPVDLLTKPIDFLRCVICHEGGHRRISRIDSIPRMVWNQPGFSLFFNANEDPRNDSFVSDAYPRYRQLVTFTYDFIREAEGRAMEKAEGKLGHRPRFVQACFEYMRLWFEDFCGRPMEISQNLPEDVRAVIEKTLPHASSAWRFYPSKQEADESEEKIQAYARVFFRILHEHVWPEFNTLVQKDIEDQRNREFLKDFEEGEANGDAQDMGASEDSPMGEAQMGPGMPGAGGRPAGMRQGSPGAGSKGGSHIEIDAETLREIIDRLPPEVRSELERRAREALRELERQISEELRGKLNEQPGARRAGSSRSSSVRKDMYDDDDYEDDFRPPPPPRSSDPESIKRSRRGPEEDPFRIIHSKNYQAYRQNRAEVAQQISRFEQRARAIFKERKLQQWLSERKHGQSIDLRKRINEVGKGVHPIQSRAWEQRLTPSEKDFAIALLVDLSGSMSGSKIAKAFRGAIVLTEPLKRLQITNGVFGFNSELFVYKDFKEELTPAVRARMGTMITETQGGMSGSTDDGWALTHVSEWLEREKARQQFIIVLTDGESSPSWKHAGEDYKLENVVRRIREETGQKLIGLGIGPNTGFVSRAYPNGEGEIDENELPDRLANLLERIIRDADKFKR